MCEVRVSGISVCSHLTAACIFVNLTVAIIGRISVVGEQNLSG
jgi:hypothetical protein